MDKDNDRERFVLDGELTKGASASSFDRMTTLSFSYRPKEKCDGKAI